jgi:hypothetical protein
MKRLSLILLTLFISLAATQAQTPQSAENYLKRGQERSQAT